MFKYVAIKGIVNSSLLAAFELGILQSCESLLVELQ